MGDDSGKSRHRALSERESGGTARLHEAVAALRTAVEERTRERLPLDWAKPQTISASRSRGLARGRVRLEKAVAAFNSCLTVIETAWPGEWVHQVRSHLRETNGDRSETDHQLCAPGPQHPARPSPKISAERWWRRGSRIGRRFAGPPHRRRPGPTSQELTTATASISIIKSGPARRVTPTVVLVGVATPR
jgi:hypothetical protein